MSSLLQLLTLLGLGYLVAWALGLQNIADAGWYTLHISALLAVGLYASTFDIDRREARKHLGIIFSAVTIGVVLKAAIIGSVMWFVTGKAELALLGIVVAQIDPLSVAGLMRSSRLSAKAKTILGAWASFDDPISVILTLYAPVIVGALTGTALAHISTEPSGYFAEFLRNIAFASAIIGAWLLVGKLRAPKSAGYAIKTIIAVGAFVIVVQQFWMLAIALIGLYVRPSIDKHIDTAIRTALCTATFLLGALLINGVNIGAGILLGISAYGAQIVAGFLLTHRLPRRDQLHIAFAQQNGITAIVLALLLEALYPGTIAVVAPAIVVINALHIGVNRVVDRCLE